MGWIRQFKRKKIKEFSYDNYARLKKEEAVLHKRQEAKNIFNAQIKGAIQEAIPTWLLWLITNIPPVWYKNLTAKSFDLLFRLTDTVMKDIAKSKMPKFLKAITIWCLTMAIKLVGFVLIRWIILIKNKVLYFGIAIKFKEKPDLINKANTVYSVRVTYFFREYLFQEITL
jgi:hypothetical protein